MRITVFASPKSVVAAFCITGLAFVAAPAVGEQPHKSEWIGPSCPEWSVAEKDALVDRFRMVRARVKTQWGEDKLQEVREATPGYLALGVLPTKPASDLELDLIEARYWDAVTAYCERPEISAGVAAAIANQREEIFGSIDGYISQITSRSTPEFKAVLDAVAENLRENAIQHAENPLFPEFKRVMTDQELNDWLDRIHDNLRDLASGWTVESAGRVPAYEGMPMALLSSLRKSYEGECFFPELSDRRKELQKALYEQSIRVNEEIGRRRAAERRQ